MEATDSNRSLKTKSLKNDSDSLEEARVTPEASGVNNSELSLDNLGETSKDIDESDSWTTELTSATSFDVTEASDSLETELAVSEPVFKQISPCVNFRQDILNIEGRQIRSEDFEWAKPPIKPLAEIILEKSPNITGSNLEHFLKIATLDQKIVIFDKLQLELPIEVTLSLVEDEQYWRRMCTDRAYPTWDIWRFSGSWKSMFAHKTVQELIESFNPEESNLGEFQNTLKAFSNSTTLLKIEKLVKVAEKHISIDLLDEDFDEQLDDIISAPPQALYLDFERVFECLPNVKELILMLQPQYLDHESFHLSVPDFNSFFRGLTKLNLQKLKISNGTATNEQLVALLRLLLKNTTLTELDLSYNFIDDNVCHYISKLLLSDCPVKKLILKNNTIMDEGISSIAAALSVNTKLKKLDVSLNLIEDGGGRFLAEVLASNSTLVDLDVSKVKIESGAGREFSKLVQTSNSIRSLKMQENRLGEESGKLFTNAMEENRSLLELDIRFCGFSYADEANIYQYILRNRKNTTYSSYLETMDVTASEFLY